MRIKLPPKWTKRLQDLPESGMGYQRVDVRFADGRKLTDALVFNAEELEAPPEFALADISDLRLHSQPSRSAR